MELKEKIKDEVSIRQYIADKDIAVRNGRIAAIWRGGDGLNVTINDAKGLWHDFVANEGGDLFALVMRIEQCTFPEAVRKLVERYGIDTTGTTTTAKKPGKTSLVPELTDAEREERRRCMLPKASRDFVPVQLFEAGLLSPLATEFDAYVRMTNEQWCATVPAPGDVRRANAAALLRKMFMPNERIWIGSIVKDEAVRSRCGMRYAKTNLKPPSAMLKDEKAFSLALRGIYNAHRLATLIESGEISTIPAQVSLNPQSGMPGNAEGGRPSYDCIESTADFRHVLIEFDNLFDIRDGVKIPSRVQTEILAGLIEVSQRCNLFKPVALSFSGQKSVHAVLEIPAHTREQFAEQCAILVDLFASADDPRFRADISIRSTRNAADAIKHVRLPGAIRPETGRLQRLLWTA